MNGSRVVAATLVLALGGCAGGLRASATWTRPAVVAARVFPRVLLVSSRSDVDTQVAEALAQHLRGGEIDVQRCTPPELHRARRWAALGPTTAVLWVEADLRRETQIQWVRRDVTRCDLVQCAEISRRMPAEVPVLEGRLRLTLRRLGAEQVVDRWDFRNRDTGGDWMGLRWRMLERLSQAAQRAVDVQRVQVAIQITEVEAPQMRTIARLMQTGQWFDARVALEQWIRTAEFQTLSSSQQAGVYANLSSAQRFDEALPVSERFDLALVSIERALRLDSEERYLQMRLQVQEHRDAQFRLGDLARTRHLNFSREQRASFVQPPVPPESYRDSRRQ